MELPVVWFQLIWKICFIVWFNPIAPFQHLLKLRKACTLRGCKLLYLPPHFDRHRSNTSRINFKTYEINWKIEIYFVHAQQIVVLEMYVIMNTLFMRFKMKEKRIWTFRVDEKTPLSDLLRPYLEDTRSELDDRNLDKKTDDPVSGKFILYSLRLT